MSYGIQLFNSRGGTQFDSDKNRETYIVTSSGSGTSAVFSDSAANILFVRGSNPDYLYWGNGHDDGNFYFHAWDVANAGSETVTEDFTSLSSGDVTMKYFIAKKSNTVTVPAGEKYGILIKSPNGTTQFDSRTIISNENFTLTSAFVGNPFGIKLVDGVDDYVSFSGGWPNRKKRPRVRRDTRITGARWRTDTNCIITNTLDFDNLDQVGPAIGRNQQIKGPIFTATRIKP
jgi:hypothetical protein